MIKTGFSRVLGGEEFKTACPRSRGRDLSMNDERFGSSADDSSPAKLDGGPILQKMQSGGFRATAQSLVGSDRAENPPKRASTEARTPRFGALTNISGRYCRPRPDSRQKLCDSGTGGAGAMPRCDPSSSALGQQSPTSPYPARHPPSASGAGPYGNAQMRPRSPPPATSARRVARRSADIDQPGGRRLRRLGCRASVGRNTVRRGGGGLRLVHEGGKKSPTQAGELARTSAPRRTHAARSLRSRRATSRGGEHGREPRSVVRR